MQSFRRAAYRAAVSATAAATRKSQLSCVASHLGRSSLHQTITPVTFVGSRYFSQTFRLGQEEDATTKAAQEAAENLGSTAGSEAQTPPPDPRIVYVKNFMYETTEDLLREEFGKYGEITSLSLPQSASGMSKGFAFINYATKEAADKAVADGNLSFWHGRRLFVDYRRSATKTRTDRPFIQSPPSRCLYIGNIPYETTDVELNRLFSEFENLADVRVAVDRNTGWPRGFAHADFIDEESARKAFEKINGMEINGRPLRVDYSASKTPTRPSA